MEQESGTLDFGALRSLLHGEVSPARWRELMWLVSGREWDVWRDEWLPDVLERWPDATRVWLMGLRWSCVPKAANQLVCAYHITREANAAGLLQLELERLRRHALPLMILGVKRVSLDAASALMLARHVPPSVHTLVVRLSASRLPLLARALLSERSESLERLELRDVVEGAAAVQARLVALAGRVTG